MNKIRTIFYFILLITSPVISANYEELMARGDSYYKKMDLLNAMRSYEEAYEFNNTGFEILSKLTRVYNDYGEDLLESRRREESEVYIKKGIEMSEKLLELYPDKALSYTYRALSLGNYAMFVGGKEKIKFAHQIRDNARKAVKLNPDDFLPYIILGIYNREIANLSWLERAFANTFFGNVPEGSFEESEKMLLKALSIDSKVVMVHYQLAKTYRYMENREKELYYLKTAINLPVRDFRDKYSKRKAERRLANMD